MHAPTRIAGVLVTLALAATPLAGCRIDTGSALTGDKVVYCTIMADPPHLAGSKIAAPGRYRCDGTGADTITMTVTLQRKAANGKWARIASQTFIAHGANTSRARTEGTRTKAVRIACALGQFRTVVHAVEVSRGKTRTYDMHSVTVPSPCR